MCVCEQFVIYGDTAVTKVLFVSFFFLPHIYRIYSMVLCRLHNLQFCPLHCLKMHLTWSDGLHRQVATATLKFSVIINPAETDGVTVIKYLNRGWMLKIYNFYQYVNILNSAPVVDRKLQSVKPCSHLHSVITIIYLLKSGCPTALHNGVACVARPANRAAQSDSKQGKTTPSEARCRLVLLKTGNKNWPWMSEKYIKFCGTKYPVI